MNVKTLALAAAAAAAATSAQAADLPLAAEPVNYVKACDAFGAGYFQLPGKDTCIKLGGRIRAQYVTHNLNEKLEDVANDYEAYVRGYVYFTSMTATDFGTIKTYTELEARWTEDGERQGVRGNDAWIQLGTDYGSFLFGREGSAFDEFTGYTWIGPVGGAWSDTATLQASFTADLGNGFTATASLEDSSYRGGDENAVDFVGALKLSQGWGSFKLAGAAHNKADGDGYGYAAGATASFNLDMVKEGTEVTFQAQYADEAGSYIGVDEDLINVEFTKGYNLSAGLETSLTEKVSAQLDLAYIDVESTISDEEVQAYSVNGSVVYSPVAGLGLALAAGWADGEVNDVDVDDVIQVGGRVQYTF
ncbi:Porin subfamily protein [Pseudovibrio ascidiaceicola]|uniref:Porin n=1 Tax=Pseudovibrio ascidiaceicola TaxID=285279 RepID=A0A1I4BPB6_9HYPH|nr:porin [Pseudovibrio ascidiaceicola]SFK69711.1 Porin subfamily protein [Pseudovibrio ascidiaceicola]